MRFLRCIVGHLAFGLLALTARGADSDRQNTLHEACSSGDIMVVRKLLAEGVDPNGTDHAYRNQPLHAAITRSRLEVVRLLVKAGAKLNGTTPAALEVAAEGTSKDTNLLPPVPTPRDMDDTLLMIDLLLKLGADLHANDDKATVIAAGTDLRVLDKLVLAGGTLTQECLVKAVQSSLLDVFERLLKAGFDPKETHKEGRTLLHVAAAQGRDKPVLWERLLTLGIPIDARDKAGRTALFDAVEWGNTACISWLLKHGTDINMADEEGRTPLMLAAKAAMWSEGGLVKALIEEGSRLDLRDTKGFTALEHAANAEAWETMNDLLEAGSKPVNALESFTALARATLEHGTERKHLMSIAEKLVPQLSEFPKVRVDGLPLLSWAVMIDNLPLAELLLRAGSPVNAVDDVGRTPLMLAAMIGANSMSQWLSKSGADSGIKDHEGRTAADWAEKAAKSIRSISSGDKDDSPAPPTLAATNDLFAAIAENLPDEVSRIVSGNKSVLTAMRGGLQPVHLAAALGRKPILEWLLDHGASISAKSVDHLTPAVIAVEFHQLDIARHIATRLDAIGKTALLIDLRTLWKNDRHLDALKIMLDLGWDAKNHGDGQLAVEHAIQHDDLTLLQRLLGLRVPLTTTTTRPGEHHDGNSNSNFLELATWHDDTRMLAFLLDQIRPNLSQWQADITAALHYASSAGKLSAVKLLVENFGADVNAGLRVHHGASRYIYAPENERILFSPICLALEQSQRAVVEYLLSKGAKLLGSDSYSRPVLASAVISGDIELVRLMLKHQASLEATSNEGRTALHEAAARGYTEIVRLLVANGVKTTAKDREGRTPADLAKSAGYSVW